LAHAPASRDAWNLDVSQCEWQPLSVLTAISRSSSRDPAANVTWKVYSHTRFWLRGVWWRRPLRATNRATFTTVCSFSLCMVNVSHSSVFNAPRWYKASWAFMISLGSATFTNTFEHRCVLSAAAARQIRYDYHTVLERVHFRLNLAGESQYSVDTCRS
jgi:hypothetical protein